LAVNQRPIVGGAGIGDSDRLGIRDPVGIVASANVPGYSPGDWSGLFRHPPEVATRWLSVE